MDSYWLLRLILIFGAFLVSGQNSEEVTPPFPRLLDSGQIGNDRLHIITESVGDEFGYETTEEFVDFRQGKNTIVRTTKNGHSTTFLDAKAGLIYRYKPYSCQVMLPEEVEATGFDGLAHATAEILIDNETKRLNLYGVAAIWLNAEKQRKQYLEVKLIYSASKDIYKHAHKWVVRDEKNKLIFNMYFVDTKYDSYQSTESYALEMIEIQSQETNSIIKTINVLSTDSLITEDVAANLMQLPVGYGCMNENVSENALIAFPQLSDVYMGPLLAESYKIELEVTATKYQVNQTDGMQTSSSSTIGLQLARHEIEDTVVGGVMQLIRHRDTNQDIKRVLHHLFNVEYSIDLRTGICNMTSMGEFAKYQITDQDVPVTFNNGLGMDLDLKMMKLLFAEHDGYYFIKQVDESRSNRVKYFYFERNLTEMPARIVRVYSMRDPDKEVNLERVTKWKFDPKYTEIIESYHFNLLEASELSNGVQLANLFDVSAECYLDNKEMRHGKDYAWFELTYPLSARFTRILAANQDKLKAIIYSRFLERGHLSFFKVPRMELMFQETGFILRVLLIDMPKLSLLFDKFGKGLRIEALDSTFLKELSVDIDHCTDLCRLHNCMTMSFCQGNFQCVLSSKLLNDKEKFTLVRDRPDCNTYKVPDVFEKDEFHELSLHRVLSRLQNQDYSNVALPKVPEELNYPQSESGLDETAYKILWIKYLIEVSRSISKYGSDMPMLTFAMPIDSAMILMLPEKFEIENDPLREFSLGVVDQTIEEEDEDRIPPFHDGLVQKVYSMWLLTPSDTNKWKARIISGLNYDQCALVCVDNRCNSFSYCVHRQECIITDIYNISSLPDSAVGADSDCFIAQRDFISEFNRFPNVKLSDTYQLSSSGHNPSECAHSCMLEQSFKCLAFDYCKSIDSNRPDTCYYFDQSQLSSDSDPVQDSKLSDGAYTGCDHYGRSYLGDFVRIEYRELVGTEMAKLDTEIVNGLSVSKCAERCAAELPDCTAFQFCINSNPSHSDESLQSCQFILSAPKTEEPSDNQVIVNSDTDGGVKKVGKMFVESLDCHVFTLNRDSGEAKIRQLAFDSMTSKQYETIVDERIAKVGLSLGQGFLLYLLLTLMFAVIGCGVVIANHHKEYLRHKFELTRSLLGF